MAVLKPHKTKRAAEKAPRKKQRAVLAAKRTSLRAPKKGNWKFAPFSPPAIPTRFLNDKGLVLVDEVAVWFGLSQGQFAETVGVSPETFHRRARVNAPKTQSRVKEMLEIVNRIALWAGGKDQALAWYRAEPIPAFGGRTAESIVKDGRAADVRDYLDHVALGGFA